MKSSKSALPLKSFQDLKEFLKRESLPTRSHPAPKANVQEHEPSLESEEKAFQEAMRGVQPISRENCVERTFRSDVPEGFRTNEDAEILEKLRNLVNHGVGFQVADTPEYIEGTGYHVHREVARRLHRGDYSIQAHVDLHGLVVEDAKDVFDQFVKWAVTTGKTGILIVHGRGLSSPVEPVLKKKVVEWLTRGPWRKWVAAYSSARICDGGAGATYVLLRQRPISKRQRIRKEGTGRDGPVRKRGKRRK